MSQKVAISVIILMRQLVMSLLENPRLRKALWILLLALTVTILLYPVSISADHPLPVQTIYLFPLLSLFAGLFYFWMLLLLVLLFSNRNHSLEKVSLCLVFALVFSAYWILITPWGASGDGLYHMAAVRYIRQTGEITFGAHTFFAYLQFPALQLVTSSMAEISGLGDFQARTILLVALNLSFTLILYVAFLKLLKNPFYSSLAVILCIASSILIPTSISHLHPVALATLFIALFLLLVTEDNEQWLASWERRLLFILLLSSATIGHLYPPFLFFFILLSMYALYYWFKVKGAPSLTIVFMPLVWIFSWELYGVGQSFVFEKIIPFWPAILEDLRAGEFLWATKQTLTANVGLGYPWWGNVTRLFWWSFVLGIGTFLMLLMLPRLKKYGHLERFQVSALVGTLLTTLLGAVGTVGAVHGGISRYLWVGPFFVAPCLIKFLMESRVKKLGPPFLFIALLLFSFPMFLTNHDTLCAKLVFPSEHSAGKFIEATLSSEKLYWYGYGYQLSLYYVPGAKVFSAVEAYGRKEQEIWSSIDRIVEDFVKSKQGAIFVDSKRLRLPYQEYLGIPTDHPKWKEMEEFVSQRDKIYDNHLIQIYR
ncbi:hypothetical protein M1M86_00255 [Dehalococcoidales bacterium]|nr:hypothetical protein [Dehalococcoidales bacterium]